jgi:hypothetical protein
MGRIAMSYETERPPLFMDKIPDKYYIELYKTLSSGGPIYVLTAIDDGTPKIFFDTDSEQPDKFNSFVFHKKDGAVDYLNIMKKVKPNLTLIMTETNINSLIKSYDKIFNKNERNKKAYRSFSCLIYKGRLRDMEVFWAPKQKDML